MSNQCADCYENEFVKWADTIQEITVDTEQDQWDHILKEQEKSICLACRFSYHCFASDPLCKCSSCEKPKVIT